MSVAARPVTRSRVRTLLSWLHDPSPSTGITFGADPDAPRRTYVELADQVRQVAAGLRARGVSTGDVVTLVVRAGPDGVAAIFGTLAAGATPSLVAAPLLFGDAEVYARYLRHAVATVGSSLVLTEVELLESVRSGLGPWSGHIRTVPEVCAESPSSGLPEAGAPEPHANRRGDDLALLQFTSGSSGLVRPIRVPDATLELMIDSIRAWLQMDGTSTTVTWLPIQHDMGLIGCLLTPIIDRSDIVLLRPEEFVRSPSTYLRALSGRDCLSAMPGFALDFVARAVGSDVVADLDLSGWRALVLGAERLDPGSLGRFADLLAPAGFRRRTFCPAYGLAEATLAVTGLAIEEVWRTRRVDAARLALGQPVVEVDEGGVELTGCGEPLTGTEVRIEVDGLDVGEGTVGEIVVTGSSVAGGYAAETGSASLTRFDADGVRTGDAGFLSGGQLYVLGRLGDSVKVRGVTVFAEAVEAAAVGAGVPAHRIAALLGHQGDSPTIVVLVEGLRPRMVEALVPALRREAHGAALTLMGVARDTIERTTSGKPRRRVLWTRVLDGTISGETHAI